MASPLLPSLDPRPVAKSLPAWSELSDLEFVDLGVDGVVEGKGVEGKGVDGEGVDEAIRRARVGSHPTPAGDDVGARPCQTFHVADVPTDLSGAVRKEL